MTSSSSASSSGSTVSDSESGVKKNAIRKRKRVVDDIDKDEEAKEGVETSSDSDSDSDSDTKSNSGEEEKHEEEIQVLSHAAQRKLKKLKEKQKGSHGEEQGAEQPGTVTAPRRQNSVWVGNLAFKTTEQSLRDFFTRHIPGCEITRVNMPGKTGQDIKGGGGMRGQNKGFAYVDFSTQEGKVKAIECSEQNLDGRKLLIKDGSSFEGRPSGPPPTGVDKTKSKTARKILAAQKQPPAPTLFFGNLGFQVTESSLKEMLEHHQETREVKKDDKENEKEKQCIRKVRLGTFEDTGKCKGWAFVDFHGIENATLALINLKNHFLDGRKLVVEYASQEAVRRGGGKPQPHEKPYQKQRHTGPKQDRPSDQGAGQVEETAEQAEEISEERPFKKTKLETDTDRRPGKPRRTKPGAALAMAKRETAAIVPSSGKRIVF